MVSRPEAKSPYFNLRKKLFGRLKKDRVYVHNVPTHTEYQFLKTLPLAKENREMLFTERDMRLEAGEDVYILVTVSNPVEDPSPDNRATKRWRSRLLNRLMRPIVRRELRSGVKASKKELEALQLEIDSVFEGKEDPGLVLPGGQEVRVDAQHIKRRR